jgi:hypothetical protein
VVEHWQLFQNTICDVYILQHARSETENWSNVVKIVIS